MEDKSQRSPKMTMAKASSYYTDFERCQVLLRTHQEGAMHIAQVSRVTPQSVHTSFQRPIVIENLFYCSPVQVYLWRCIAYLLLIECEERIIKVKKTNKTTQVPYLSL